MGALFSGGFAVNYCIAGVMMTGGNICPVINGVMNASVGQLAPNLLYEFRTLVFHPEPIRAGQVYSSSVCNGANARTSQVWVGTTHVVLTMRAIDPTNASTTSARSDRDLRRNVAERARLCGLRAAVGTESHLHAWLMPARPTRRRVGAIGPAGTGLADPRHRGCYGRCGVLSDGG